MANMSYCRFQNTLTDLRDCYDHIDDPELSSEEDEARQNLTKLCSKISIEFDEDIDD